MPKMDSIHPTQELLIIALFLSWTKWGLFELLWSLDTAGRICSHFSPLWSRCSPCLQFTSWSLFIDHQAVRIESEKAIHHFTHFMVASRNSEVLWSASGTAANFHSALTHKTIAVESCKLYFLIKTTTVVVYATRFSPHSAQNITNMCLSTIHSSNTLVASISYPPLQEVPTHTIQTHWAIGTTLARPSTDPWRSVAGCWCGVKPSKQVLRPEQQPDWLAPGRAVDWLSSV